MCTNIKKRVLLSSLLLGLLALESVRAQGNGVSAIQEATSMITSFFDPATKLMLAIGALSGLVGAVKVFMKMSGGDQDTGRSFAAWFYACIFLVVSAAILRAFFL